MIQGNLYSTTIYKLNYNSNRKLTHIIHICQFAGGKKISAAKRCFKKFDLSSWPVLLLPVSEPSSVILQLWHWS